MAKDRIACCIYYQSENNKCEKGRTASHKKYCQKCNLYEPRDKQDNSKKYKRMKIKKIQCAENKIKEFLYNEYSKED